MCLFSYNFNRLPVGLFVLSLLATGCVKEIPGTEALPERTLLVYMAGDNNLSAETGQKIAQLEQARLNGRVRLLVYVDARGEAPRLLEMTDCSCEQGLETRLVKSYEECNAADPAVFAAVLREVQQRYPSDAYGLIVFSHATGWLPAGAYADPGMRNAVTRDGASEMEVADFAAAIPDGMFEFIVFEACFMAGIEVAWELKNKTRYIVASSAEIVSPGFTDSYARVLPLLFQSPSGLEDFVRLVAESSAARPGDYASYTISLIKTSALEELGALLRHVGLGLFDLDDAVFIQSFNRYGNLLFFDFLDYFSVMKPEKIEEIRQIVNKVVVCKSSSPNFLTNLGGFAIQSHSGLTTYIYREQYPRLNEAYRQLKWYREVLAP